MNKSVYTTSIAAHLSDNFTFNRLYDVKSEEKTLRIIFHNLLYGQEPIRY